MKKLLFFCIVLASFILRTYQVSVVPPSLSWDEVSIGYNAYSIIKTFRDEHGRFLPLDAFAAYGDYKPPLAVYSAVPFIALFGLTDVAVRLPAAVFGTMTVVAVYFLVMELFWENVQSRRARDPASSDMPHKENLALLSSLLIGISPWHIQISRGGFEAVIAHFFAVTGIWCILSSRLHHRRMRYMWLPFVAAIYTFNSARYFVPMIGICICIWLYAYIRRHAADFAVGLLVAFVLLIPIIPHLFSKEARLRFKEVNIFTELSVVETANARLARGGKSLFANIFDNRRIGYARSFLMHFTDNVEPNFLFVRGDGNPKFSTQDTGQLYMIEAPFLIVGFFALFMTHPGVASFLTVWLISSIIPAATARETPHALRILNSLPVWQIWVAYGLISAYLRIPKYRFRGLFTFILVCIYAGSLSYYLHTYYRHYAREYSGEWQYGYREALQFSNSIRDSYDRIVVSEKIGRAYMYTLFYTKTDPTEYRNTRQSYFDTAGFYHVTGFGKYRFTGNTNTVPEQGTLYIGDSNALPEGIRVIETIRLLNGNPVLTVFDKGSTRL